MNTFATRRSLSYALAALLCTSAQGFAAELVLQKVPPLSVEQAPAYPENLARYFLGAQIETTPQSQPISNLRLSSNSEDSNAAEAALLCGDPTVGYALPTGKTTVLVSLPKIENVSSISFSNSGAKGEVAIATSNAKLAASSPQWQTALNQPLSPDAIQATVGPIEAKYVQVTFNVTEPGRIAGFGVYSSPQVSDFTAPRARKLPVQSKSDSFALISYNLSDIHAKARALYVSSGSELKQANNMIDDQAGTAYTFAAGDSSPATVIDLGKPSTLRRLSAAYTPRAGNMEFYVMRSLPGSPSSGSGLSTSANGESDPEPTPENAPATVNLDDAAFQSMKAVGSVVDDGSRGRASVDFPATSGRYVMVRWTPAAQNESFSLAEVAAFGGPGQPNTLLAANTALPSDDENRTQMTDGKTVMDGKTMLEAKDMPAEGPLAALAAPAEGPPPTLPQPPPFTFVPVLVPSSP